MLPRQRSVTTPIPQGGEFSLQLIIHMSLEEQQPDALTVLIVLAKTGGEPVLTTAAWPNGYNIMFPVQKTFIVKWQLYSSYLLFLSASWQSCVFAIFYVIEARRSLFVINTQA